MMQPFDPFLSLSLTVDYANKPRVLNDLFLQMRRGEILGLVGHSGSGKSTLALAILRLLHLTGGTAKGAVYFEGQNLMKLSESEMREVRGRDIGLVLQSPMSSLNPHLRIGSQLREAWYAHAQRQSDWRRAALEALENVALPADDAFLKRHPAQLSVGQAQRVLIAMATLHRPKLLIADEATSALDLITQAEILALFAHLNRQTGAGVLFISHDLMAVSSLCHRIAILHEGQIVEVAETEQVLESPAHPYTQELIAALPSRIGRVT